MRIGGYHIGFAGSSHVRDDNALRQIAEHIGEEVVRRGHRLVTGGCSGGLTQLCVERAAKWLEDHGWATEQELRIISIVPREKPPTVSVGRVLFCEDWSRDQRRAYMASLEDSLITIAGVKGTAREGQCAFCMGTPVVPIYGAGGATLRLRYQIEDEFATHPLYDGFINSPRWTALDRAMSHPKKAAEAAVGLAVEMAMRKTDLQMRRADSARMPGEKYKVFVVMPFDNAFEAVYDEIKLALAEALHYASLGHVECFRADDQRTGKIDDSVFQAIREADLLVVDLTGNNGNVLLEYGYGLALYKKAILLNQRPEETKTDVKNHKQIKYDPGKLKAGRLSQLRMDLVAAICELELPRMIDASQHVAGSQEAYAQCEAVQRGFNCIFRNAWDRRAE